MSIVISIFQVLCFFHPPSSLCIVFDQLPKVKSLLSLILTFSQGTFSRYDYQRTPTHAAVKSFKVALPAAARDVYYRDVIGNISTSNLQVQEEAVEVELRPRFPLFGGWKTQYYIGYNVPSYEYLHSRGKLCVVFNVCSWDRW